MYIERACYREFVSQCSEALLEPIGVWLRWPVVTCRVLNAVDYDLRRERVPRSAEMPNPGR